MWSYLLEKETAITMTNHCFVLVYSKGLLRPSQVLIHAGKVTNRLGVVHGKS